MPIFRKKIFLSKDGKVSYKRSVVLNIVNLACKEIGGVAGLYYGSFNGIKNLLVKSYKNGTDIAFAENTVSINVSINVFFGYSVNDIAFRVQENIKRSIESMTEYKVDKINVYVKGVVFNNDEDVAVI